MLFENLTRSAAGAKVGVMEAIEHIKDIYSLPGFRAAARVKPHLFDPYGLIVTLTRRKKKWFAAAAAMSCADSVTVERTRSGTWTARPGTYIWNLNTAGSIAPGARA
jgi:hypothetical protein